MTIWVVRAGKQGERANLAIEEGRAFIGWEQFGDMSSYDTRDKIRKFLKKKNLGWSSNKVGNYAGQFLKFIKKIEVGDTIAIPLKGQPAILFGKVTGGYEFIAENPEGCRHSRKVEWMREPIPRSFFKQDILNSFGSLLTVFGIGEDKERRIRKVIDEVMGGKKGQQTDTEITSNDVEVEEEEKLDLEELAQNGISDFIGRNFKNYNMEKLVAGVLQAQGFTVRRNTSKGKDGGVDILAGRGAMGLDEPRLAVQVKSSDAPIDIGDYRQLEGVLKKFNATHGLFVSWGGFKSTVEEEAKRDFFKIRLWNAENLVHEIQDVYPNLPKKIQADLPMKQIWLLIDEVNED